MTNTDERHQITKMEWRLCIGFDDYEVSECGDLRRAVDSRTYKMGARVSGSIDVYGYIRFCLRDADKNKKSIHAHRLVAEAFIGPPPSVRHEVAHNNGSRVNNHYSNLRWALPKENRSDMQVHGTATKGTSNGNSRLSNDDVAAIREEYTKIKHRLVNRQVGDLASQYGISHAHLCRVVRGKNWSHLTSGGHSR